MKCKIMLGVGTCWRLSMSLERLWTWYPKCWSMFLWQDAGNGIYTFVSLLWNVGGPRKDLAPIWIINNPTCAFCLPVMPWDLYGTKKNHLTPPKLPERNALFFFFHHNWIGITGILPKLLRVWKKFCIVLTNLKPHCRNPIEKQLPKTVLESVQKEQEYEASVFWSLTLSLSSRTTLLHQFF